MCNRITAAMCIIAALTLPQHGQAQGLMIYPGKGQSQAQQDKDRYECHVWAVQQTGYDPTMGQSPGYGPGPLGGAARGAAIGAVGGAIGGNAGKGAAIGAGTGALIGGFRGHNQAVQQQQQGSLYNRAFGTCLQGRGYTVG